LFFTKNRTNPHRHHPIRYGQRTINIGKETGKIQTDKTRSDAKPFNRENKTDMKGITTNLIVEIRQLIEQSRQKVAMAVNSEISMLYWHIGKRINSDILNNKRAKYGKQIVATLSQQLTQEYGRGWGEKQLRHCIRFAETFPDEKIVYTLCRQLSWSHIRLIMFMEDAVKRNFYTEICKLEHLSVRQLRERIKSMLFERTAISKKPEKTIKGDLEQLKKEHIPKKIWKVPFWQNCNSLS